MAVHVVLLVGSGDAHSPKYCPVGLWSGPSLWCLSALFCLTMDFFTWIPVLYHGLVAGVDSGAITHFSTYWSHVTLLFALAKKRRWCMVQYSTWFRGAQCAQTCPGHFTLPCLPLDLPPSNRFSPCSLISTGLGLDAEDNITTNNTINISSSYN
jgi:hypothetical protein